MFLIATGIAGPHDAIGVHIWHTVETADKKLQLIPWTTLLQQQLGLLVTSVLCITLSIVVLSVARMLFGYMLCSAILYLACVPTYDTYKLKLSTITNAYFRLF